MYINSLPTLSPCSGLRLYRRYVAAEEHQRVCSQSYFFVMIMGKLCRPYSDMIMGKLCRPYSDVTWLGNEADPECSLMGSQQLPLWVFFSLVGSWSTVAMWSGWVDTCQLCCLVGRGLWRVLRCALLCPHCRQQGCATGRLLLKHSLIELVLLWATVSSTITGMTLDWNG